MMNSVVPELMEKARQAKNAAELQALAKENGMEMTEEKAQEIFQSLHKSDELSDEELDNVAGGGCSNTKACSRCGHTVWEDNGKYRCQNCGNVDWV